MVSDPADVDSIQMAKMADDPDAWKRYKVLWEILFLYSLLTCQRMESACPMIFNHINFFFTHAIVSTRPPPCDQTRAIPYPLAIRLRRGSCYALHHQFSLLLRQSVSCSAFWSSTNANDVCRGVMVPGQFLARWGPFIVAVVALSLPHGQPFWSWQTCQL